MQYKKTTNNKRIFITNLHTLHKREKKIIKLNLDTSIKKERKFVVQQRIISLRNARFAFNRRTRNSLQRWPNSKKSSSPIRSMKFSPCLTNSSKSRRTLLRNAQDAFYRRTARRFAANIVWHTLRYLFTYLYRNGQNCESTSRTTIYVSRKEELYLAAVLRSHVNR